jgi:hypothetical protein
LEEASVVDRGAYPGEELFLALILENAKLEKLQGKN